MTRLLKFIIIIVVLVGIAVGGVMFYLSMNNGESNPDEAEFVQKEEAAPVISSPIFTELEPFTVTLYGETRNRILYTSITLRLDSKFSQKQIAEYMPEVRDRVLKVLSIQKQEQIQTAHGREALSEAIRSSLSKPYSEQLAGPKVSDVLFTAFVVQ